MTSPMPPQPSDPTGPGGPGGPQGPGSTPPVGDEPNPIKRWIPAIVGGVVLLIALIALAFSLGSDSDSPDETTTTTSSTTTSTTSTTSTTTRAPATTSAPPPTTAAPTTAPPTTAPPTTAAPTTTPTTQPPTGEQAALIAQCNDNDEFACYEVGRLGLTPPSSINPGPWTGASDDAVAAACQEQLNTSACFVAGQRGLVLGD